MNNSKSDDSIKNEDELKSYKEEERRGRTGHLEDDWEWEIYSNSSTFVCFDKYRKGEVATFCQLPVSPVNHGKNTVSTTGDILSKVHESCLEDISGTAEILQIEGELDVSTRMVEYSGTPKI